MDQDINGESAADCPVTERVERLRLLLCEPMPAVPSLMETLDKPSEELVRALLAAPDGHQMLLRAMSTIIPRIAASALRSRDPHSYSGAFPGPLVAMMNDRRLDAFITRWRVAGEAWKLPDVVDVLDVDRAAAAAATAAAASIAAIAPPARRKPPTPVESRPQRPLPPGVRPADVFNGSTVRRKHAAPVARIISEHAGKSEVYFVGGMLNARQGTRWSLFGGYADRSPSWWGHPSTLSVGGEEVRARVMLLMGVDLRRSRTYSGYVGLLDGNDRLTPGKLDPVGAA